MSNTYHRNCCGQALVEFLIVLPLLLLFLAAIVPLLSLGASAAWLDERLWLSHFIQENQAIQSELHDAHRRNMTPRYFMQGELEEKTELKKMGVTFPMIKNCYPGYLKLKKVIVNPSEDEWITPGISYRLDEKISRKLAITTSSLSYDSDISFLIKELSILGIFPWEMKILENMNFELFHLNLDSLPDTKSET